MSATRRGPEAIGRPGRPPRRARALRSRVRALVGVLIAIAASGPALAAEPAPVELSVGQPAPYAGLLISRELALRAMQCQEHDLPMCRLERVRDVAVCKLEVATVTELRRIEKQRGDRLAAQLQKAAEIEPPERPWWQHPALWAGLGVAVGIGASVAIVEAVR